MFGGYGEYGYLDYPEPLQIIMSAHLSFFFLKVNPWKTSGPLLTENLSPKRSVVIGVHPILSVGIRPLIQMSIEILSCHVRNIKHDEGVNLSE